ERVALAGVVAGPALDPEAIPEQPRGDVAGPEVGLDGQGPRAARGVEQRAPAVPAREAQHGRGERLLERRLADRAPPSAAVQRLAGDVEVHGRLVLGEVDEDRDV